MVTFCGRNFIKIFNILPSSRQVTSISCNHARLASLRCRHIPRSNFSAAVQVESCDEPDALYKRLEIEVKGHDPAVLNSYERFVTMTAQGLDIPILKVTTPPKIIEKYTLLKSVHIFKKKRVQYETRTHFKVIELKHLTGSTADSLLEYIQRNLPEGVAMKVTRHRIEKLPEHLQPPKQLVEPVNGEVS